MDDSTPAPRPGHRGGTVEPANPAPPRGPEPLPGERYELRDPFAEVTHRGADLPAMLATAERLGSLRVTAIDAEGRRRWIQRVDGQWERGPERPPPQAQERRPEPGEAQQPAREAVPARLDTPFDPKAERAALRDHLEAALRNQYLIKRTSVKVGDATIGRTEYRYRGETQRVAFTESAFRLATDTNSPSVARSMVDLAEARSWKALRVSGHEEFRRMVWFEATLRGVRTVGYEPMSSDLDWLRSEREARQVNRIEPARTTTTDAPADKASGRGGGGRKAVLAAIEAVLLDRKVPQKQREAIMVAATEKLAQRIRDGQAPRIKLYDPSAPSQRPAVQPTLEPQRAHERALPTPVR